MASDGHRDAQESRCPPADREALDELLRLSAAEECSTVGALEDSAPSGLRTRSVVACSAIAGVAASIALLLASKHGFKVPSMPHVHELSVMKGQLPCSLTDPDTIYRCRSTAFSVFADVHDSEFCRRRCFDYSRCSAWTLTPDGSCSLFELDQDEEPEKDAAIGAVSGGLPCGGDYIRPVGTLYCFALMNPVGYEKELLKYILAQQTSLFACDATDVYSNKAIKLSDHHHTVAVDVDLHCKTGGEFGTALNLDIFLEIWGALWKRGRWSDHEWTVKVDPDAVFFPDRLRTVLAHHPQPTNGVYLNNCQFGLHGPVEVFSKSAVGAFQAAVEQCKTHFWEVCNGDCYWGEDIWTDQCMEKVLNVQRDDEWRLLVEDHCDGPTPFSASTACDQDHVAFHPFKDVDSYAECMSYAQLPAVLPQTQAPQALQAVGV